MLKWRKKYNILLDLPCNIHFIVISTPVEPAYVCASVLYFFVQIGCDCDEQDVCIQLAKLLEWFTDSMVEEDVVLSHVLYDDEHDAEYGGRPRHILLYHAPLYLAYEAV